MENVQAFLAEQMEKIGVHAVQHGCVVLLFSLIAFGLGIIVHHWKQARYGMRVTVRACWLAQDDPRMRRYLISKVLMKGSALSLTGEKDIAAILVRAAKRCKTSNCLIDGKHWSMDACKKVLKCFGEHLETMFAAGSVAMAMKDKDVTRGEFALAAFRDGNGVSVIVARREDVMPFPEMAPQGTISVSMQEHWMMTQLSTILPNIGKDYGTMVVLYM